MMDSLSFIILTIFVFIVGLLVHLIFFTTQPLTINKRDFINAIRIFKLFLSCGLVLFFMFLLFMFLFDLFLELDAIIFIDLLNKNVTTNTFLTANAFKFENLLVQSLITMLLIIMCSIYYCVKFAAEELTIFLLYISVIFNGGAMLLISTTPICIFIAYELILIPTALVLTTYSKTGRAKEATIFMIIWTQVGAIILLLVTIYLASFSIFGNIYVDVTNISRTQLNLIIILIFFAFATKMPIWPFYWWLPEAHVEVSTNFSIVLSGVTVKFAFLGFLRFISILGGGDIWWLITLITLFGMIDSALKIDSESDIKKIVAYQTVSEMHLMCMYAALDFESFIDIVLYLFPGHCWISTISFIIVDMITKRYHSRNVEHLYGIMADSPRLVKFIFLTIFIFGSLPGTTIFTIEYYINVLGSATQFNAVMFIVFQCLIVVFSKNIWWLLLGGDIIKHNKSQIFSMTKQELFFILFLMLQLIPTLFFTDIWFI